MIQMWSEFLVFENTEIFKYNWRQVSMSFWNLRIIKISQIFWKQKNENCIYITIYYLSLFITVNSANNWSIGYFFSREKEYCVETRVKWAPYWLQPEPVTCLGVRCVCVPGGRRFRRAMWMEKLPIWQNWKDHMKVVKAISSSVFVKVGVCFCKKSFHICWVRQRHENQFSRNIILVMYMTFCQFLSVSFHYTWYMAEERLSPGIWLGPVWSAVPHRLQQDKSNTSYA